MHTEITFPDEIFSVIYFILYTKENIKNKYKFVFLIDQADL
jgi:hypothetical protein